MTVLIFGGVCLVAAIVGGGLKAAGIELPALTSRASRWLLAGLGAAFIALGIVQDPSILSRTQSSTQAPAPSSTTAAPDSTTAAPDTTTTISSTSAPTATTSTNPSTFSVIRHKDSEALARRWALDLDTGRQAENSYEDGMDLDHGSLALLPVDDAEMAQVNGRPNAPETCQNETQRIPDVPIWLSRPQIKSGDQFCIYTNDGNLAMLKVIERHNRSWCTRSPSGSGEGSSDHDEYSARFRRPGNAVAC